ncbi:MAG: M20 family metallo-hydrolase [Pseudomonadota bacterium]
MDNQLFEKVSKTIDSFRNDSVELQKKLISTPAIGPESGGEGEMKKYQLLEPLLKQVSDELTTMHAKDDRVPSGLRPNAMAKIKGKNNKVNLWIMAHMDVVPAGDEKQWKTKPFEATIQDGKIIGRGAEDNHHGICAGYFAMKALKQLKITPPVNVCLLLISDEEVSNEYGITHIIKNHKSLFNKNDLFIVPDSGDEKGETIECAEKHVVWLKFTTTGKQSHAAFPNLGKNACRAAAHLIVAMEKLRDKYSMTDKVFVDPSYCTIEPTKRLANVPNVNTIPPEDVTFFDCRLLPEVNVDKFIADVKEIARGVESKFGVKIAVDIDSLMPASYTPPDSAVVKRLQIAAKAVYNTDAKPIGIGGATVSSLLRQEGFQAACFGKIFETCHQPNEFTTIDGILGDAKVFAHTALQD